MLIAAAQFVYHSTWTELNQTDLNWLSLTRLVKTSWLVPCFGITTGVAAGLLPVGAQRAVDPCVPTSNAAVYTGVRELEFSLVPFSSCAVNKPLCLLLLALCVMPTVLLCVAAQCSSVEAASHVLQMRFIATHVTHSVVCVLHHWAPQKRPNRLRCYWGQTRVDPRNHVLDSDAHWHRLANTIEWSVRGWDAASRHITFTTCSATVAASSSVIMWSMPCTAQERW